MARKKATRFGTNDYGDAQFDSDFDGEFSLGAAKALWWSATGVELAPDDLTDEGED